METPDVTLVQKGAGALYGSIAIGCMAAGVTGLDLVAYLSTAAIVSAAAMIADRGIRGGRASIEEAAQYSTGRADDEEG